MKCSNCSHDILEKTAKFCSECGHKLSAQPANIQDAGSQPKSLVAEPEGMAETSESQKTVLPVDSKGSSKFPKRANDDTNVQPKKKAASTGKSVDPQETVQDMEVQQSESGQESTSEQTSECDEESKPGNKDDTNANVPAGPPPKRSTRSQTIAACDRLTIYFHAVLSKDFKFDQYEDRIFVRAGFCIGTWEDNAVELSVIRDLGEHGFLVEGSLVTNKNNTIAKSIPYKYVVYRKKKNKYEYEYIYKLDSGNHTTNRCLFVKPRFLNDDGDWHQYDDIIRAEPSKNVLWRDQRKSPIQGREIAGNIMLETIFDLLRSWTDTNLRSFIFQLNQFFEVYGEPYVYEEKEKKWHSLDYGPKDVRRMLKEFMLNYVIPQLQKDGDGKSHYIQDPMRAAVIMLYVRKRHQLNLDKAELHRLCSALCLPKLDRDGVLQYWADFSQHVSFFKDLPGMLADLINIVKKEGMPRWILVLPLLHLLRGTIKPFEVPTSGNLKYGLSWAGLQGLDMGSSQYMNSQGKKALVNLMKSHSHLMLVDALLVRSCLYLMPFDDLMECVINIDTELLDILCVVTNKAPDDSSYSNFQTVSDILSHIQGKLIEEKYSRFTEAYRRECLATAVRLLQKICKGVKATSYNQNYTDIPVTCMNLVGLVSDFVHCEKQQETQEGDKERQYAKDLVISQAMHIMKDWVNQFFRQGLLNRSLTSWYQVEGTNEIEMWDKIISIRFKDEECTKQWREMFTMDFEGKYKRESALDQIEFYCTKIEELTDSYPHVADSVEKCALEAVASLCQTKSEGKLFEKPPINWKFGKLVSAIIQKSWPRDSQGKYQEVEEVVLQHLLSWTAAKDIFQLHGAEEKLFEKLSEDAKYIIAIAISSFTAASNQLVQGNIKISLLNIILEKKDAFLELLKIDCLSENEQYKDTAKMKRLLQWRQDEVAAVYHEKKLVDVLLTWSHKLEEHISVDAGDLEERQQVNIEIMSLDHFMEVNRFDQLSTQMAGIVTYFEMDEEIRNMAEVLHTYSVYRT